MVNGPRRSSSLKANCPETEMIRSLINDLLVVTAGSRPDGFAADHRRQRTSVATRVAARCHYRWTRTRSLVGTKHAWFEVAHPTRTSFRGKTHNTRSVQLDPASHVQRRVDGCCGLGRRAACSLASCCLDTFGGNPVNEINTRGTVVVRTASRIPGLHDPYQTPDPIFVLMETRCRHRVPKLNG